MKEIKVITPAKINLSLKVQKRRPDGFHPIESIMQAISLFDYVTVQTNDSNEITINGNSNEIPYDSTNIAYKAAKEFLEVSGLNFGVNIYIEKNIPVAAGLAGGSTNAAGVLYALNKLTSKALSSKQIFDICAKLGSDLNFCMRGSKALCTGKGDDMLPLEFIDFSLTLVKPKNLKISTKEAYGLFDELKEGTDLANDLEFALLEHYKEIKYLHNLGLSMSGSGPSFFMIKPHKELKLDDSYMIIDDLHAINHGVCEF